MPVRDPNDGVFIPLNSATPNAHVCCCTHMPDAQESHPYTKKSVFSFTGFIFLFTYFLASIFFAGEITDTAVKLWQTERYELAGYSQNQSTLQHSVDSACCHEKKMGNCCSLLSGKKKS